MAKARVAGFRRTIVLAFGILVSLAMAGMVYLELAGFPGTENQGKLALSHVATLGNMEIVSGLVSQLISDWTMDARADVAALAASPLFGRIAGQAGTGWRAALAEELAAFLEAHPAFNSVALVDPLSQEVHAQAGAPSGDGWSDLERLAVPGYEERLHLFRKANGQLFLHIFHQVHASGNTARIAGVLVVECDLGQALVKLVWAVGSEIHRGWKFLMVLRSQGQAFRIEESSTLGLGLAVFRAASLGFPPETLALDGVEGPYEGPGPDGLPSLAYHRQVRLDVGIGMGLVLLTSLDVAEHEVFNDLRRQIILWLVLLSGVIGLGIVVAARISMPVKELASTAKQIATGDLSARAMVNQRSELGQFAQVFNRMADQLRDWSAGLERQVEERTRDLRLLSLRQEAILSAVPDIIMEVDTNKVYTWANPAGYVFFGPDVIGREAASYFVGEQDTYVVVRPLFDGNSPPIYVESWQRRRDGEARLLAWWCKSLTGDGGEVIGTLSTARDITEERRAAEKIRQALREKETLIQEVYHRTKNTLQVIQGILELQAAEHPGQGEFQALVRDTSLRIQAIALVHQMLYRSSDLSRVSATVYLKELSGLILGMAGKAETPVDLEISQEDHFMTLDTVIPLGLILNELMTNSLKYAFEAGRRGWISIGLEGNGDHGYRFNYSDDGRGLPEGFDCRFQGGLGMRLIYGLAEEQLGGKVAIAGQDGFRFQFEFVPLDAGPRV